MGFTSSSRLYRGLQYRQASSDVVARCPPRSRRVQCTYLVFEAGGRGPCSPARRPRPRYPARRRYTASCHRGRTPGTRSPRRRGIGQGERRERAAIGGVPEPDGRIAVGCRGERLAVGRERQRRHGHDRAAEDRPLGPAGHVPEPDRAVLRAAGQGLAVGRERDAEGRPAWPSSRASPDADGRVPERDGSRRRPRWRSSPRRARTRSIGPAPPAP